MAEKVYELSLAFPGDPQFDQSSESVVFAQVLGDIREACRDLKNGRITETMAAAACQVVHVPMPRFNFRDSPNVPGAYFGFLGQDRRKRSGVSQKTVDTMLTIAGLMKANEGRDIAVFGSDTDFLPLANYVLGRGQKFYLRAPTEVHEKWKVFNNCKDFSLRSLPSFRLDWSCFESDEGSNFGMPMILVGRAEDLEPQ